MRKHASLVLALAAVLAASGCATLVPATPEAQAGIPAEWPIPATTAEAAAAADGATVVAADVGWRDFFTDPRLEDVVGLALDNNRDLRVAILNVERARAQYRIQRADRVPNFGVYGQMERMGGDMPVSEQYTAGLGMAAFELDLFGRVRNLSEGALQQYLATAESQRSAQLALVAEVAQAWLTLAADREQLRIAEATLETRDESMRLAQAQFDLGAVSQLVVDQARTQVESTRVEVARLKGQVARDRNALNLLAGTQLEERLLPEGMVDDIAGLTAVPAGLPAEVLLRRPDIIAAEHRLLGASASIGAARAAFFPSISLTGSIGSASTELSDLFESGTKVWSFIPQINIPIFQGGRLRSALGMATADRDIALAEYEKAIQSGFREVADALALSETLAEQLRASEALLEAATSAERLAELRYQRGLDSNLERLDAQRSLYSAQQQLVSVWLAEQANRVALYKALGGGWPQEGA